MEGFTVGRANNFVETGRISTGKSESFETPKTGSARRPPKPERVLQIL